MPVTHLHKSLRFDEEDVLKVELNAPACVYLLEHPNYHLFMQNMDYDYYGKEVDSFPFLMKPPHPGIWELVIFPTVPGAELSAQVSIVSP